jgi:hypothetical protein
MFFSTCHSQLSELYSRCAICKVSCCMFDYKWGQISILQEEADAYPFPSHWACSHGNCDQVHNNTSTNKSSGNKVHFNAADLTTEESGGLSRLHSIVPPPDFKLALEEEKVELSQVWVSYCELGLGPGKEKLWGTFSQASLLRKKQKRGLVFQVPRALRALLVLWVCSLSLEYRKKSCITQSIG